MTIKQQQNIRSALLWMRLLFPFLSSKLGDVESLSAFSYLLNNEIVNPAVLRDVFTTLYGINFYTSFRFEQVTSDYKEIKCLYDEVIKNTAQTFRDLEIANNPVAVFAMFVYLYRKGYLSYQKHFEYSNSMLDLPMLYGVDVVRGSGVCRSISSFFTDLCNELGMKSTCMAVYVSSANLDKKEELTCAELIHNENSEKVVAFISAFTRIIPIANHFISHVSTGDTGYVFDPTNDLFLYKGKGKKLIFANDTSASMSHVYFSEIVSGILGQANITLRYVQQYKEFQLPSVSYEEYVAVYRDTLSFLEKNVDTLENLFTQNHLLYTNLSLLCEQQDSLIKRLVPLFPHK